MPRQKNVGRRSAGASGPKSHPPAEPPPPSAADRPVREIRACGVTVHNLKDVDLTIPHGQWVTFCGRSGSGKSSLALETLYAEGQRRYIESFSAYTRQYLQALEKPQAREISGIPPAIAVTRSSRGLTGRATIGSHTEVLDYLREVYAKLASPFCATCQRPVQRHSCDSMVTALPPFAGPTRAMIGFTWQGPRENWPQVAAHLQAQGFSRFSLPDSPAGTGAEDNAPVWTVREDAGPLENAELPLTLALESLGWSSVHNPRPSSGMATEPPLDPAQTQVTALPLPKKKGTPSRPKSGRSATTKRRSADSGSAARPAASKLTVDVIVDRVVLGQTAAERLLESLEAAVAVGGRAFLWVADPAAEHAPSTGSGPLPYRCLQQWGWRHHFSTALECDGCNQSFPLPTPALFSYNSPVGACPTCEGFGSVSQYDIRKIVPDSDRTLRRGAVAPWNTPKYAKKWRKMMPQAEAAGLPLDVPFAQLTADQVNLLWEGSTRHRFPGLNGFFRWMEQRKYKMHYRIFMARWRSYFTCPACQGQRLNAAARQYRLEERSLPDACHLKLTDLQAWLQALDLTPAQQLAVRTVLPQVMSRLQYLLDVGLSYVTLDRQLRTLSGGELQRTAMTTALGSALVNLLYVLDEPSVGLHPRDIDNLTSAIGRLHRRGNTVITIEHELAMLAAAQRIVEIGPGAGASGGQVVFDGSYADLQRDDQSLTAQYLAPSPRETPLRHPTGWIGLTGARGNNLQALDVEFPTGVLCVVTGVSGAGKSSLVRHTLVPALQTHWGDKSEIALPYADLKVPPTVAAVAVIDGSPIGRSPRSNPVTYVKAFDPIRKLFADTTEAKSLGLTAGSFSFNVAGGRCEKCEGDGQLAIDMQFMPDVTMVCPECQGRRYHASVLEVTVSGLNIHDVLSLTAREAFTFFRHQPAIQHRLKPLLDVGLDYLPLGQGAPTLSAGESQRLKLAAFLGGNRSKPTLFVMDEPTTGLHPADIEVLLHCFDALLGVGHSLLIVEHNLQLMGAADYLIDVGPEAADQGGRMVAAGPPSVIRQTPHSLTGRYLADCSPKVAQSN